MEQAEESLVNPHILEALAQGKILWKDAAAQLAGLHLAWVAFCENSVCPSYMIVWVSEFQEMPILPAEAEKQLYEVGWAKFDGHWLCIQCYHQKVQQEALHG